MQGKILIVDPIATNRIMLKVKLMHAYYRVLQADTMQDALEIARKHAPDLIITSVTLPDGDAATLCTELKKHPALVQTPLMAIATAPNIKIRLATIAAGAMDLMTKPVNDTLLLARVRNLIRGRHAAAEWQMRDDTNCALGLAEPVMPFVQAGHTVLVCHDLVCAQSWARALRTCTRSILSISLPSEILRHIQDDKVPDAFVLILNSDPVESATALRLVSSLRANLLTRHAGILVLQTSPDPALAADALDLGADDLMTAGFDAEELTLRLKSLMVRKQAAAQQRDQVRNGLKAAVFDELTGLHNRRYAMPHLSRIADQARSTDGPFSVMLADLDHFKRVNDLYGHVAGDAVLVECARRLRRSLRDVDLLARIGGEEFLIVMPGTTLAEGRRTAHQLCQEIWEEPFKIPGRSETVDVTISIGLTIGGAGGPNQKQTAASLLDQADKALYSAKMMGRNQVTLSRPAA